MLCVGAGVLGGSAALVVPTRQVVRAAHPVKVEPSRRITVHASAQGRAATSARSPSAAGHSDATAERYRGGMIINGITHSGAVLFTFDDGPNISTTPELLDALDARKIKAVFFIVGQRIAGRSHRADLRRKLIAQIAARGHIIGNHTFSHAQLTLLSDGQIREEILRTERLLTQVIGKRPWLFRPPGGARSERVDTIVAELGYTSVLWNMDTNDTSLSSPDEVVGAWERVSKTPAAIDGGIVLLHDLVPWSVQSFERIYSRLLELNIEREERGQVPWTVVSDLDAFFVPRADASPSSVAPPLGKL